tara:strand:+ start:19 stop:273 length:255 start_codon:yes stop_codon:yes gene_type:complete
MATDIIAKCISANPIDNGGILVAAPKGGSQLGSNYQINTYSSQLPTTGTVYNKYDTRFTGIAPCWNSCGTTDLIGSGVAAVLFV